MGQVKNRDGTTTYYPVQQADGSWTSGAPWETQPGWTIGPTAGWDGQVGTGAVHHDWRDNIVPLAVASIFAGGPFLQGAAVGGAAGGTAAAGLNANGTLAATMGAPAGLTVGPTTGTGMTFGLGSLAKFFGSRGGEALVNAATNLYGGRTQANAYTHSADVQAQAARDALAWEQAQYAKAQQDYNDWLHGGPVARLDELIGQGRSAAPGAPPVNTTMPVGGPPMTMAQLRSAGSGQTPAAAANAGGGTVTLRSPQGTTRQFAATDPSIAGYLARGATRVS